MNPLVTFKADRDRAREAGDPMANLCTVANLDGEGVVQQRTLVLRDVGEDLGIFVNATSPKWPHLQTRCSVLTSSANSISTLLPSSRPIAQAPFSITAGPRPGARTTDQMQVGRPLSP